MVCKNVAVFVLVIVSSLHLGNGYINGSDINNLSENATKEKKLQESDRTGRSLHKECTSGSLNPKCLKIHVLSVIEDLDSREELPILPGLSIVKENQTNVTSPDEIAAELSRQFPGNPDEKLNRFLLYKVQDYLDGHSLRYRLLDQQTAKEATKMVKGDKEAMADKTSGRGKGGGLGGKGGGGLVAAAMMMKGTLAAAALGALALLAGKALMTALMSLLLSALVGMKGGGGGHKTTYEIIAKPETSHHHSHSHEEHHEHEHGHHGGYRRAYDANYNSYMPYDTTNYAPTTVS
ncbi:hypothetical protein JYU34_019228 [Plutella xylostella]|uniref:Osiris 16 n=1 Tax=Plutella xylostella TaxID=51655 RepID=A0ABQ7PWC5_PLUXY|nr:hypothetical protein JYU34_019228 [Plutella xylostella]